MTLQISKQHLKIMIVIVILLFVAIVFCQRDNIAKWYKEHYTIDVEACLEQDNFIQDGNKIIEINDVPCLVESKMILGRRPDINYIVTLQTLDGDHKFLKMQISPIQYSKLNIGDEVIMQQHTRYTSKGYKLYSTATIVDDN